MNSNLFHNLANAAIILLAALTAGLLASGCTTLASGLLECSHSAIPPAYTAVAIVGLGALKVVVNITRDGLSGLFKPQPPVGK